MEAFLIPLLNALTLICVLVLVSLGMAIIFGMMDVINLAHGEFLTIGAYTLAVVGGTFGSFWLALAIAPLVGAAAGVILERTIIRHLYARPLETILATLGLSFVIQKVIELAFGAVPQPISSPIPGMLTITGVEFPAYRIFLIVFTIAVIAFCIFVYRRSRFGLDLRAAIQDREIADALGIDTRRTFRVAFASGAGLAALAGVLVAPMTSVNPVMGLEFLAKSFFVVIVGGLGTISGVIAGSTLIGGLETVFSYQLDGALAQALVLVCAVIIVRIRPKGLVPG